ncbi:MAG: hypothetical protein ACXWK2_04960 [Rhizomicrobium sp.]
MNGAVTAISESRFRDRAITFANGSTGRAIDFETANPVNFFEAISAPKKMQRAIIDGKLFLPPDHKGPVCAIIGDRDEWCLPQQLQGHIQAMGLCGGDATIRIVEGAQHSFDRETAIEKVESASVSPGAPTIFIADDGAFVHPLAARPDPVLTDRDLMVYAVKSGYGIRGAKIGSASGQPALFRDDMVRFWRSVLQRG